MKKYILFILVAVIISACIRDSYYKEIEISFNQFLDSIEAEDMPQIEKLVPFLSDMSVEEQNTIFESFRVLKEIDYDLDITKISDDTYTLRINPIDSASLWAGITIPYQQNSKGLWVMAPLIESVQFIDIIPAKK